MVSIKSTGLLGLFLAQGALATPEPTRTQVPNLVERADAPDVTEINGCHLHGETLYVSRPRVPPTPRFTRRAHTSRVFGTERA